MPALQASGPVGLFGWGGCRIGSGGRATCCSAGRGSCQRASATHCQARRTGRHAGTGHYRATDTCGYCSGPRRHARCTQRSTGRGTSTKLRCAGDQPGGNARPEDAQAEQGQRGEHDHQRMVDGGLVRHGLEFGEQPAANADDHRQNQHLDAGRDHIAQYLLGEKGGLVPKRKGHQHKACEGGQLELD
ncbi:hypothetical protein D3C76_1297400 [compost metagenome]